MSVVLTLEPLVFLREHPYGACYAFPMAAPKQLARGGTVDAALEEQRSFLTKYLARCPAGLVAKYVYPEQARLLELPVVLPRGDLPRRLNVQAPVTVPCVVVPEGRAHWVHVVPLGHSVYVRPTEELSRRVTAEIERMAWAQNLDASEYLRLLPTPAHRLVRLPITVERDDASDASRRAADRRRQQGEADEQRARERLASVGTELLSKHRGRREGPPVVGRDREIRALASLLDGRERMSVALVGEPLVGKSAIVEGLVSQALVRFSSHPVFATSGAQLVAGQSGFGQLEERVDAVMKAAEAIDAVLYFDDLGDLFAGTSGGIEDIASMMRPWLVDGRVRVVGELSPEVLEHHEKRHVAFFGALQRITVEPLDAGATRAILRARIGHQAATQRHRPRLLESCVDPLVDLSERYLRYHSFPGKAVVLAEELRAIHDGEVDEDGRPRAIGPHDVYRAFSVRSGIPMFLLREEQAMRHAEVLAFFSRRVIGQREAIERVASALCTVKAGLQPPSKPLANLLFLGPTGVGKTEVAKTLARLLFGDTSKMVRFDMSEYGDPLAAERLIRGTEREDGELTRRVRQQPFCVVLLDEIEKAHPAVFDLLLQVLGEGRLSDARGRTTWFHNCIIIMTSNLGASHRRPRSGFGGAADSARAEHQHYLDQVERHFRPELVNRIDRIIPFSSLSAAEISEVARVALRGLLEREGLTVRGIELVVSEAALADLASGGFSDVYGARALRRHLEDHLVTPIARLVSEAGSDAEGGTIHVALHEQEPAPAIPKGHALVAKRHSGALEVVLMRRPAREERRTSHALQWIAGLRRSAATCRGLESVVELRDRRATLVAELAGARHRSSPATLAFEHARLDTHLRALDDAMEALEGAEDLAIAALAEGESADAYVDDAAQAHAGFERAFVQLVLGAHALDAIVLRVKAHTDTMRLTRWLLGLLEAARQRGWRVLVHRWEDRERPPEWPPALPWGPPREPAWVEQALQGAEPEAIARAFRGVLVRIAGPLAGSSMAYELGLHRYLPQAPGEELEHVDIGAVSMAFDVTEEQLGSEALALGKPEERGVLARTPAVREHDPTAGEVRAPRANQAFSVDPADYWSMHERIVFSLLADALVRGEDAIPGDGTWS
ncbi:AAA family ATPase [Paraliomyxa miuraensis]|uniref:AAA family ATPase n=1 Tax=Paraliomyxa miuraensis TaxID=376150 RepID=UPI00224DFD54|nr:AAA family ATPase [Paraliomyxa miuraensis]MCX4241410.1 AAA family ATPase [Paraliomyxa miuraensis]